MKRLVLLFALLFSVPAFAQVPVQVYNEDGKPGGLQNVCSTPALKAQGGGCSLLSSTTPDAAVLQINGSTWASVKITFSGASAPTYTIAYSIDGGTNYLNSGFGAPYLKRTDFVATNPTVQPFSSTGTVSSTWELPLAANVTHVKVFVVNTGGTSQTVTISGGQVYVPGMPVTATLYDALSGSGAAIVQAFDGSGWSLIAVNGIAGGAVTSTINAVALDSTGTAYNGIGNTAGITIAANSSATIFLGTPLTGTSVAMGNTAIGEALPYVPPRFSATVGISAAQVNRLIVLARR